MVHGFKFTILAEEIAKRVATYQDGNPTAIIGLPIPPSRSVANTRAAGHDVNCVAGTQQAESEPSPASCPDLSLKTMCSMRSLRLTASILQDAACGLHRALSR